jgi:hypothetical protein
MMKDLYEAEKAGAFSFLTNSLGERREVFQVPEVFYGAYDNLAIDTPSQLYLVKNRRNYGVMVIYEYDDCYSKDAFDGERTKMYKAVYQKARLLEDMLDRDKRFDEKFNCLIYSGYQTGFEGCDELAIFIPYVPGTPFYLINQKRISEIVTAADHVAYGHSKSVDSDNEKKNRRVIDKFRGEHLFLSNFFETPVHYGNLTFRNAEAAFQSRKTLILEAKTPLVYMSAADAKKYGRSLPLRPDWENVKLQEMYNVVHAKFTQNEELQQKLLDTGDAELIEGNVWKDSFWGVYNGKGENHLGKILMKVRAELANAEQNDNQENIPVKETEQELPSISGYDIKTLRNFVRLLFSTIIETPDGVEEEKGFNLNSIEILLNEYINKDKINCEEMMENFKLDIAGLLYYTSAQKLSVPEISFSGNHVKESLIRVVLLYADLHYDSLISNWDQLLGIGNITKKDILFMK